MGSSDKDIISWEIDVSLLNNKYIARQIIIVFSLAILFVLLVLFLIELFSGTLSLSFLLNLFKIILLLVAIFSVLTVLGVFLVMGNRYNYRYTLDPEKGIWEKPQAGQRRKNSIVNGLLVFFGLMAKNPAVAGAGVLAQSRQEQHIKWKDINKVETDPRKKVVVLKKNNRTRIIVFCLPDNFDKVAELLKAKV